MKLYYLALFFLLSLASAFCSPGFGTVTVTTSETPIFSAGNLRTYFTLSNTGAVGAYVKTNSSATALTSGTCTYLAPGAVMTVTATGASNPSRNNVSAITASGTTTIAYEYDDNR